MKSHKPTEGWEKRFEKQFNDLEYKLEATKSRIPINTYEGVADLGTVIALTLKKEIKLFVKKELSRQHKEDMERVIPDTKSVKELLPIMGEAYKDLSVKVAYKEGYNRAIKEILSKLK